MQGDPFVIQGETLVPVKGMLCTDKEVFLPCGDDHIPNQRGILVLDKRMRVTCKAVFLPSKYNHIPKRN